VKLLARVKITDKNKIPELVKELEYLASHQLEIGILSGEQESDILLIANVHEFGTRIQVTDKMRAYLHSIGIHLRGDTKEINIPERSFIRQGFDSNINEINSTIEKLLNGVLEGKTTGRAMLEALGGQVVSKMQEYLINLSEPPNHPATIERKGSSNPLVDTSQMVNSITWRIVGK